MKPKHCPDSKGQNNRKSAKIIDGAIVWIHALEDLSIKDLVISLWYHLGDSRTFNNW
jgi:hypothetical protein